MQDRVDLLLICLPNRRRHLLELQQLISQFRVFIGHELLPVKHLPVKGSLPSPALRSGVAISRCPAARPAAPPSAPASIRAGKKESVPRAAAAATSPAHDA